MSEEAYELLEEGTELMNSSKFTEAYDKYIAARELFQKISWQREVSRINNELLFKLKREQKQAEIFEDIKIKKVEEDGLSCVNPRWSPDGQRIAFSDDTGRIWIVDSEGGDPQAGAAGS